ncbi:MAG TPA: hemerythrin domain-containing protein [Acidimicrobiales bacterium]|nr:hemerythrin domain-containing protein [Acidimicrobiales bacterium]
MNALTLLKQDHGNVEELFRRFETADADDVGELSRVRDLLIEHLSRHAAVEEQVFYPAIRQRLGRDETFAVLEGLEEHHLVKLTLAELEKLPPTAERFRAKMTVLVEGVRHHVREEEDDLFKLVRDAFTVEELNTMGEQMERLKAAAPSRPHPLMPDVPPFNLVLGLPAALLDRVVTPGRRFVEGLLTRRARART